MVSRLTSSSKLVCRLLSSWRRWQPFLLLADLLRTEGGACLYRSPLASAIRGKVLYIASFEDLLGRPNDQFWRLVNV